MNYGFVIDNKACIGCHACSTACKSENDVPLGVHRTWVKTVEQGSYPDVTRHFQVTRCNHCANPPCVRICPVTAMYQRDDGIVEFDQEVCIGCKACMQACPYDAIHVDPETSTIAKCHFCAHRVERGLEPACVVVCPEHAIIAGDLDDPDSEIRRVLSKERVTVPKPEQGTAPKLFYIEGNAVSLTPTATERAPASFLAADSVAVHGESHEGPYGSRHRGEPGARGTIAPSAGRADSGAPLRAPQAQGQPSAGPIAIGRGRMAEQMVQVAYNAQHKVPWHWPVPTYLITKGIAAGAVMLMALGALLGLFELSAGLGFALGLVGLIGTGVTTALLVYDLERPERFLRVVLRPQWRSWLTRGAFILIGFSLLLTAWCVLEGGVVLEWWGAELHAAARPGLLVALLLLGLGTAVYTAFLFGQAEGRDLWQSPLLPIAFAVQAVILGAGVLLVGAWGGGLGAGIESFARWTFGGALVAHLLMLLLGELAMPHASEVAARAAHLLKAGRYAPLFWVGALGIGHILPLVFLFFGTAGSCAAAIASCAGLFCYEYAFVMAPQEVPNS